jgi:molybdate transport system substrate-binding protein
MTRLRLLTLVVALALIGGAAVTAQNRASSTISVLSTNAITGPLTALAAQFEQATGTKVAIEFETSPAIARRLAAGQISGKDVLVLSSTVADQAIKDGKASGETRAAIGKVGVGAVVRRGAAKPDISSVDALKATLRQADALLYSQGTSGIVFEKLMQGFGMADLLKTKGVQTATGDLMLKRLSSGRGNEIGFTQVSEIMRAEEHGEVTLVGPLPAAVQGYTAFDAVVMTGSSAPAAATAFVRTLTAPAARKLLASNGWEF